MRKTFTTADGAVLSYEDIGTGDVILFLHGWSQSAAMFQHQLSHFSQTYRVIALDFRGHGQSQDCPYGNRIYRLAADVREMLTHLEIARCHVVGWSLGASVLWAYIDLYGTGSLDRIVFVDEPASVMRQPGMSDDAAADAGALFDAGAMAAIAEQILGTEGTATREAFLSSMITKDISENLKAWLLAENLRVNSKAAAALFINHCTIDWSDVFRHIDRPTLVVGGEVSHVNPRSQQWIHQQIPGSEIVIFSNKEGGAHFPFIESPHTFNPVVRRFLEG